MLRTFWPVLCAGLMILDPTAGVAQQLAPVTVRPGDTIEWIQDSGPPHLVQFGGTVDGSQLTPFSEIEGKFLEGFNPGIPGSGDVRKSAPLPLTVKVKSAAPAGQTFTFTCGNHPAQMISVSFTVAAADNPPQPKTHRILGMQGLHWRLHIDTKP